MAFAQRNASVLLPFSGLDVSDWKEILLRPQADVQPIGAPSTTPGADPQEKINNYAVALNQTVENLLPTAVIASRLERDSADDSPFKSAQPDLKTFFDNNPLFEFGTAPVEFYLRDKPESKLTKVADPAALLAQLKSMQRVFKITPRFSEIRALLADDLHSASAILNVGKRRFTEKYAEPLGSKGNALDVFKKAEHVHATALNIYMKHGADFNSPLPYVISGGTVGTLGPAGAFLSPGDSTFPKAFDRPSPIKSAWLTSTISDWRTLFGSLDLCDCDHCKSMYSPSAYLVDTLKFLKDGPTKHGRSPLQVLLDRRPDIAEIELTCENTNTEMPYVDLVNEVLENTVSPFSFSEAVPVSGSGVLLNDLNAERIPTSLKQDFANRGLSLYNSASVAVEEWDRSWTIRDSGWRYTLGYDSGLLSVSAWPQTDEPHDELNANPEHVNAAAYNLLATAVYPWSLPFNLGREEARIYLNHLGVQRTEIVEAFYQGTHLAAYADIGLAREYLGLSIEESHIIDGTTMGSPSPATINPGPWDFWGLRETGNDIVDPNDPAVVYIQVGWIDALKHVSVFLQQSGLSYKELLELLGTYFINPVASAGTPGGRLLAIVSIDPEDAATCALSKLEIHIVDNPIRDQRGKLEETWGRIHRFVRLARKLGWTIRNLDQAISALHPADLNDGFLTQLSHLQRLSANLNVPLVNMLSWWSDISTTTYIDQLADGQPQAISLYKQLFRNKTVIKPLDEAFTENPSLLIGDISGHLPALVAALGISAADLTLLTTGATIVVADNNLNLANLSQLYRVASLARALKLSIYVYLSIQKLSGVDPFVAIPAADHHPLLPATAATLLFVEKVKTIRDSGFSSDELNYLLRHDFSASSGIAPAEDAIAEILDELRSGMQRIAAENTFREDPGDPDGVTSDPNGELTRKKLALLNWDTALIEQIVATLNNVVTYEVEILLTPQEMDGIALPNDTGGYEVNLAALPPAFTFPEELNGVVTYEATRLFGIDSQIASELDRGNIPITLRNRFVNPLVPLTNHATVNIQAQGEKWQILDDRNRLYTIIKAQSVLVVYDENDKKLKASRRLTPPERTLLRAALPQTPPGLPPTPIHIAVQAILDLQDELQGTISYDRGASKLRFTGAMTNIRRTRLNSAASTNASYLAAVDKLFNAPRLFIARYMRAFSIQDFATELAALPAITFPNTLKNKIYFDAAVEPKQLHFIGVMTDQQRKILVDLSADPLYVAAVNNLFDRAEPNFPNAFMPQPDDIFLTAPGPGSDASILFDNLSTPEARFLLTLNKLLPYLRRTLSERLVAQKMAAALQVEPKMARDLLMRSVNLPTHPAQKAMAEFLAPLFAQSSLNANLTAATFPDQFKTFTLLHKIASIVNKFKITSAQLIWLFGHGPTGRWLDFNSLPSTPLAAATSSAALFAGWERLTALLQLRNALHFDELGLFKLFDLAHVQVPADLNVRNAAKQAYLENLSQHTLWPMDELETLLGPRNNYLSFVFPDAYTDERMLLTLSECFRLIKRLGASASQLNMWSKTQQTSAEELVNSAAIKNAVKAKYDDKQWLAVAKPLKDPLREKQRTALVAYVVTRPDLARGQNWRDINELYEYFLVDVEMDACMGTTRILQATNSVQLFIQRCLMNLEPDVALSPEEAREWMQWRKWYRVWEANRKVLFYPENWIEPELRDDKSPFFQELENELLQSELIMDTAEDAFLHYLEKLDQVARLDIVGMYCQLELGDKAQQVEPIDILHVFGRTHAVPHIYFYRRLEAGVWSAWQKIDLDIEGDHLLPVEWNRRLYLFWPIFTEKADHPTQQQRENNEDPTKYWEIKFAWSEYKNKKWSPKKVSKESLHHPPSPQDPPLAEPQQPQDFSFKTRVVGPLGAQLNIECYGTVVVPVTQNPEPPASARPRPANIQSLGALVPLNAYVFLQGDQPQPTYLKCRFLIGDRRLNRMESQNTTVRIYDGWNRNLENILLNSNSVAYSRDSYSRTVLFYLHSDDYELESVREDNSWWMPFNSIAYAKSVVDACFDAAADNGVIVSDSAVDSAVDAINTIVIATLITTVGNIAAALLLLPPSIRAVIYAIHDVANVPGIETVLNNALGRLFGRGMTVKLKARTPLPPIIQPDPVLMPTPKLMQGIGQFVLDNCNGNLVRPVEQEHMIPAELEPLPGTRIENMMFVEEMEPSDHALIVGKDERDASIILLEHTPGIFRLLAPHQGARFSLQSPFFFQDGQRTYFVSLAKSFRFAIFFHPRVCDFIEALNRDGIPGLLTIQNQRLNDSGAAFQTNYSPISLYQAPNSAPNEDVDFKYSGAYALYNWELFFHTPFLIAMQLSQNQRFEEAQKWFHYIFNPTATDSPDRPGDPGIERFWRVKPFYDAAMQPIQTLEALINDAGEIDEQISAWQANPFKPHVIARLRVVAYMKTVVMHYIDNLIAWGDQLFRQDSIESINEATQLYVLATQILGKRPDDTPARVKAKAQTFRTLDERGLDQLSNALVEIEGFLPLSAAPTPVTGTRGGPSMMPFFCITANDKLLGYWDTVADRLFKIRHCMNIEGVERSLPLFQPPIDPALLVKAAAAGVDIASALSDMNTTLPHYRFNVMLQKATEFCNDVKALGASLLSALEKKDGEELALLRSSHEVELLKAIREIKARQVDEANNALEGLMKYQAVVTARQQYYLSRPFTNSFEQGHLELSAGSLIAMEAQVGAETIAAIMHLIPDVKVGAPTTAGATYGGANIASAVQAFGSVAGTIASILNTSASLSSTLGGYQRRQEDWTHQADLATKELLQVEKQIAAAEIRLAISEHELENHDLQIENATEVDEYLRNKFTNQELYSWMVGKLSGIYFQSYQLAYDIAKRAERTFRYELGLSDSNFIQFGYWDSLKKGLLSGERLHHDLKRMDTAYLDQNKREYEITKHISLIALDPISLLTLKETGECFVSLPEALFDMDYPGHYMRRVKSVSITIPCVTGPYAGVNCTLTQHSSTIRHANTLLAGKYSRTGDDARFSDSFGVIQSIVTSSGQNDSGLFEANLRDERYLPFEGQGAISTWRIQLPTQFKSFDYDTISDVVLHLRYTAREGGELLRQHASTELSAALRSIAQADGEQGLTRIFSLRHDFPTEWYRFLNPASGSTEDQTLTMPLTKDRFPFLFQDRITTIDSMELFVKVKPEFSDSHNESTLKLSLAAGAAASSSELPHIPPVLNELIHAKKSPAGSLGDWTLTAWLSDAMPPQTHMRLNPGAIQDILLVSRYTCS